MPLDRTAFYADSSTALSLATITANMADAEADQIAAREIQTFVWADSTEQSAQTGMTEGNVGYRQDVNTYYWYTGSAWKAWDSDWTTYTATLTNVAIGTGGSAGNVAEYRYVNGRVQVRVVLTLGTSGASVSGIPAISLPVNAAALEYSVELYPSFGSSIFDSNPAVTYFTGVGAVSGSVTSARMLLIGTNGVVGPISATAPFTWASSDKLVFHFDYEPA